MVSRFFYTWGNARVQVDVQLHVHVCAAAGVVPICLFYSLKVIIGKRTVIDCSEMHLDQLIATLRGNVQYHVHPFPIPPPSTFYDIIR